MPVPFYLQRPTDEPKESFLGEPGTAWDTYEKRGVYDSSRLVGEASFNRGNKQAALAEQFARNMEAIKSANPASRQRPSSWKDNIDYSKGYDANIEDKFRAEHDYLGLADYLSNFRMDNQVDQRAYEAEISQIRRYGRQYNATHSNANDEQSASISFLEAFDSGNIDSLDSNNPYKKKYDEAISQLGRKGGWMFADYATDDYRVTDQNSPEASTITVSFNNKKTNYSWFLGLDILAKDNDDERQFEKFAKETGYNAGEIRNILGENAISVKDGRVVVNVPKSNLEGIRFLTQVRNWCNETGRNSTDVAYASYDPQGNLITDDTQYIGSRIQDLSNLLQKTNQDKEEVMQSIGGAEQIMSTTILPYMNERQMQLMQMRNAGLLDDSKYSSMLKADNEVYENLLLGTAFSQLDLYTDRGNDDGDETLYQLSDNIERGKLKSYIRNAIRENRVSWRAGISGGKYGTYLVVTPEDNKGDLILDQNDARSGATIFIPGLFTKSVQNAFDSSTQGKTVAEINRRQQYGYEYNLQNGNILSNVGNETARLYDKNTDTYRQISREEAQNLLHQDIIIEDASKNIRNRAFNLDGTPRAGYDPTVDAKKIAIAAANELYPGRPVEEYDVDIWNPSKEDVAKRKAEGSVDRDYKAYQAYNIYSQLMDSIYKLLKVQK